MAALEYTLPKTYADLGTTEIKITNHPASAPGVTPVQVVTLYRPKANNAFTAVMMAEMERAWTLFDIDDRVKVIVVTGHGRMFCAGADLQQGFRQTDEFINEHRDGGGRVSLAIHRCRKPTIGALNGSAVGVGVTMTLPMAIRVAYKDAKVGFVFSRRGLVLEAASSYFLPRLIGYGRTMHLVSTASVYPASHSLFDGLFTELVDKPEDALTRALALADDMAANCSTVSFALMRDMVWRGTGSAEEQHLLDSRLIFHLFGSSDQKEGVQAFLEKRPVKFTGTLDKDTPTAYPWWTPVNVRPYNVPRERGSKL